MHRSVCLAAIAVAVLCCCSVPSSAASSRIAALRAQTSARASVSVPLSDTEKKWLESEWQRLMAAIKAPADKAKKWMDAVFTAYSTGRMYHNLKHVYKMKQIIQTKEFLSKLGSKADVVDLAIWMHDVVYDGKAKDNEEKSAEFSNKMLTELGVSPAVQRDVFDFVMATKTHELPADKREPEAVTALQFFLDSDLEVLSWDWKEYVLYAKDIRQEYIHYDDAAFCKGRQAVLKQLGSKPNLYERPEMRSKLEAKARANLAREIELLAAKEKDPSKPWPWEASAAPSAPAAAAPPSPRPSSPKGAGGAKLTPAS